MAQIDFSNAHIEPVKNPAANGVTDVGLTAGYILMPTTGTSFNSMTPTRTLIKNDPKNLMYQYSGTIPSGNSGTELYLCPNTGSLSNSWWRIYNISYSAGDTFIFQISANII